MALTFDLRALRRRMVEIDFRHRHRHLPGSLSALPIIVSIFEMFDETKDVFILSKGHSCAALYCVLEALGKHPDCSLVHPERDPENGVTITAGSLGHGLPVGVGIAYSKQLRNTPGTVHVLMGDGEAQEGTTWEALHMAARLNLQNLLVHLDDNDYQGSDALLTNVRRHMQDIFPVRCYGMRKGAGIKRFEDDPVKSVHLVTNEDFAELMEELR